MANTPYQVLLDELAGQGRWVGTAIDAVLGVDEVGNYGFIVSTHRHDPIADAALRMQVDSVREYARRDAQALKMSLNSLYGSFGPPTAVIPPNAHMSVVLLGKGAPPMRLVASKNYGNVTPGWKTGTAPTALPVTSLIDASKVKPNRRERRSGRAHVLPWWRRLFPGMSMSLSLARSLSGLKLIGIADPFTWGIDERAYRCAAAERDRWRDARHARLPEPRAPELRTRRGRSCSIAESYRLCRSS